MTNIAVVVLDTVRKDTFDEFFGWLPGKHFNQAYSTSHWTVPAHASLFTGKYGSELGVIAKNRSLDCSEPVIAELLSEAGYQTRAWTANPNISQQGDWNRGFDQMAGPYALKRGRNDLLDWDSVLAEIEAGKWETHLRSAVRCFTEDCATIPSLVDGLKMKLYGEGYAVPDDGASTVRDWVHTTEFSSNEFLFVNLMESHIPYHISEESSIDEPINVGVTDIFNGVNKPEDVKQAYRGSVQYLADVYQDIFEELRNSFDYIITLSDHGELLGEHGMWNHVLTLHPELVHIPIVITGPDLQTEVSDKTVSILDIHKTILSITGLSDKVDSRGYDITTREIPNRREFLTEYDGLMSMAAERMRKGGASDMDVKQYETSLRGFVTEGYYGYETVDEFQHCGSPPVDDPQAYLATLVKEITEREVESEIIPKSVESRLEDLGYM